jgi:hypothetical protein
MEFGWFNKCRHQNAFCWLRIKDGLFFTRVRYFIEKYLPKLIIKLSPNQSECSYRVKLGLISTLVFIGFSFFGLVGIVAMVRNPSSAVDFLPLLFFVGIYFLLLPLELKLTKAKISKALKSYSEES